MLFQFVSVRSVPCHSIPSSAAALVLLYPSSGQAGGGRHLVTSAGLQSTTLRPTQPPPSRPCAASPRVRSRPASWRPPTPLLPRRGATPACCQPASSRRAARCQQLSPAQAWWAPLPTTPRGRQRLTPALPQQAPSCKAEGWQQSRPRRRPLQSRLRMASQLAKQAQRARRARQRRRQQRPARCATGPARCAPPPPPRRPAARCARRPGWRRSWQNA